MVPAQLSWEWRCAIDPFQVVYRLCWSWKDIFVTHLTTSVLNSKCWIHLRARYARRISEIDGTVVVVSWDWQTFFIFMAFNLDFNRSTFSFDDEGRNETQTSPPFDRSNPRNIPCTNPRKNPFRIRRLFWMVTSRHGFLLGPLGFFEDFGGGFTRCYHGEMFSIWLAHIIQLGSKTMGFSSWFHGRWQNLCATRWIWRWSHWMCEPHFFFGETSMWRFPKIGGKHQNGWWK